MHRTEKPEQAAPLADASRRAARRRAAVFAVVLLAIGIVAVCLRIFRWGVHPQIVLFLYSIPANCAISVFSHEVALVDYGRHQPILLTTFTATLGTIAAGWLDWNVFVPLLDSGRIAAYRGNKLYRYCIARFERAPFAVLVITGFTPVPFFPFKFLAFSMRYPLARYLAAITVARAPRYLLLAWIGSTFRIPEWILLGMFIALVIIAVWHHVDSRRLIGKDRSP